MKLLTIIFVSIFTLATTSVLSGEVTDTEWEEITDMLIVTYYTGDAASRDMVGCTAFNSDGKAIGGGRNYPRGGVARVRIEVPTKYEGKTEVTVKCK
jgi:hypothetical protein